MDYPDETLALISGFGVLGYSIEQITTLLDIDDVVAFSRDMETPGTPAYKNYHRGRQTGQYTLDKELYDSAKNHDLDANDKMVARMGTQKVNQLIHQKFGL